MSREIQITFPSPGEWGKFTLVAVYPLNGYRHQDVLTEADVPAEMSGAFAGVVRALVAIQAPWRAYHVNVRAERRDAETDENGVKRTETDGAMNGGEPLAAEYEDVLELTVYAQNEAGGRRTFTARDYPEFIIRDLGAVEFFNYFTGGVL